MMTHTHNIILIRIFVTILLLTGTFHTTSAQQTDDQQMTSAIETVEEAKETATERFNLLLAPLGVRNPLDQKFYSIDPLFAADFKVVEETDNTWILIHEPLSGPKVIATVGKTTGLVQFDSLEVSVE